MKKSLRKEMESAGYMNPFDFLDARLKKLESKNLKPQNAKNEKAKKAKK